MEDMHAPVGKCNVAVAALLDEEECQVMSTEKGFQCRYKSRFHRKGVRKSALGITAVATTGQYGAMPQSTNTCWASVTLGTRSWASLRRWLQQLQREQDGAGVDRKDSQENSRPPSLPPSYWMPCRMLYISKRTKLRLINSLKPHHSQKEKQCLVTIPGFSNRARSPYRRPSRSWQCSSTLCTWRQES